MNAPLTVAAVPLPGNVVDDINTLLGWIAFIVAVLCAAKIVFVGARIAWDHKHTPGVESPAAAEFLAAVVGWIIASGVATLLAVALISAGHAPEGSTPAPSPTLIDDIQRQHPPLPEEK